MYENSRPVRAARCCFMLALAFVTMFLLGTQSSLAREHQTVAAQNATPSTMPFGPYHLPTNEFDGRYTGTMASLQNPDEAIAFLEEARAQGMHVFVNIAGGRNHYQNADGSFSLALFKQQLDEFASVDFDSYVADGTVVGHMMFDEPQDPSNWNGEPVPYDDIEAAAAYSKQLWPSMPVGLGSHPNWLAGGAPWDALDFSSTQYTVKDGDATTWMDNEIQTAHSIGLGIVLSLNVLDGGSVDGAALTPQQLEEFGTIFAGSSDACGFIMWKWDAYFSGSDVQSALDAIAQTANTTTPASCVYDGGNDGGGGNTGATMAVSSLRPDYRERNGQYRVGVEVNVVDGQSAAVEGATVTLELTKPDGSITPLEGTTGADGQALVIDPTFHSETGKYTFCVTSVDAAGLVYDSSSNVETCDSVTIN